MNERLIIINGPTAVGKTAVSVELAKRIGGEIISADSMQVYRGMDIGTAKITESEKQGIPHHLIDIIDPDEEFSVIRFKTLAQEAITDISSRGKIPIICGGTCFYIQAVLYDVDFTEFDENKRSMIRKRLEDELACNGSMFLFERLKKVDPEYAGIIHANNTKRLLHGLEFYELTGKKISEHNREQAQKQSPYDFKYYCLIDDRKKIYSRIDRRVDRMIEDGLEAEVKRLLDMGYGRQMQSMLGIGYKEMADCLSGEITFEDAVAYIKRETRHYAKKQLTWFKRERDIEYINIMDYNCPADIADMIAQETLGNFKMGGGCF